MTRYLRLATIGAVLAAALVVPLAALGQDGGALKLREARGAVFPEKQYTLALPERQRLTASKVSVTENDGPVTGVALEAPGLANGAILLIDASNSMKGAPIVGAVRAARSFIATRRKDLPVAIVVFGPEDTVLAEFTTVEADLLAAVAETPPLAEGTHIYDALIRAAELARDAGKERATVVLLSDGTDVGSEASQAQALAELAAANVRVFSVGLQSRQYNPSALRSMARRTGGTYAESASPADIAPIFSRISSQLSSEYTLKYRSLLPSDRDAVVRVSVAGYTPATANYKTPTIDLTPRGTFKRTWIDSVIVSPWLMVFIIVSVVALLGFAILTGADIRSRSIRRRMAQYVSVPTEEESTVRRAEVASMLADKAQRRVAGHRWWQSFETDVALSGMGASAVTLAGWTLIGAVVTSLAVAIFFQSLLGLLAGFVVPLVTRTIVKRKVGKKRKEFTEQLPDNLDVLAGALRAGHSLVGALNVMVDGAAEPSKSEFRRVMQDEQLGISLDQALLVTCERMENVDLEQVAIVTRLQREAGGNTAEVLDRVVENIRGRMEIRRLIAVLTAQGVLARWVLTMLPVVLAAALMLLNPDWLDPLWHTKIGQAFLVLWVLMLVAGSIAIKRIVEIEV